MVLEERMYATNKAGLIDKRVQVVHCWCTGEEKTISTILGPDLQNILPQSYDNAKVTINLRRTSNLQDMLQ